MEFRQPKSGGECMNQPSTGGNLGRSVLAVLAGIAAGIAITVATDFVLHALHVYPLWDQRVPNSLLVFATLYRTIYAVGASYITAYLAPNRPIQHAMIGGWLGFVVSILGAVTTWNAGAAFQSHWYPVALIILALPQAWFGAWLRMRQLSARQAA
jgi:hypothetical protein